MSAMSAAMSPSFPASRRSHFDLVPGHSNTTTKEPMVRPPDMRVVSALASKGRTLRESLHTMNTGPSARETALQQLTTRDVVLIPDLFEPSSGFVMPPDPWADGGARRIDDAHSFPRQKADEVANLREKVLRQGVAALRQVLGAHEEHSGR